MSKSANALFHYTRSVNNLTGIIKNGFEHRLVKEDLSIRGFRNSPFSFPGLIRYEFSWYMVCFCDIPLNSVHDHIKQYGSYGIGLNKEWGMSQGITPVRYIHYYTPDIHDDIFMSSLITIKYLPEYHNKVTFIIADQLKKVKEIDSFDVEDIESLPVKVQKIIDGLDSELKCVFKHIYHSGGFLKSYKGDWKDPITSKTTERVFYNEREWRSLKTGMDKGNIKFNLSDIKFIFVITQQERELVVRTIMDNSEKLKVSNENEVRHKILLIDEILDIVYIEA